MVEVVEERKVLLELKVLLDYVKILKLFKIVVVALIAQLDGHQQVDVILGLDVLE